MLGLAIFQNWPLWYHRPSGMCNGIETCTIGFVGGLVSEGTLSQWGTNMPDVFSVCM